MKYSNLNHQACLQAASAGEPGTQTFPYRAPYARHVMSVVVIGGCAVRLAMLAIMRDTGFVIPASTYGHNDYTGKPVFEHEDIHLKPWVVSSILCFLSAACFAFVLRSWYLAFVPSFLTVSNSAITIPSAMFPSKTTTVEFDTIKVVRSVDMSPEGGTGTCFIHYQPHGTTRISQMKTVALNPLWLPSGAQEDILSTIAANAPSARMTIGGGWHPMTWVF